MKNETRQLYDKYLEQQSTLNSVALSTVAGAKQFSIAPSVEQTLEDKKQESSELLKKINIYGVDEQEGQKVGLGVSGPIASSNNTNTTRREPRSVETLEGDDYRCEQTNTDTFLSYAKLDQWAKFPDFQARITNQIIRRGALDRIMIGFNGTSHATISDLANNPLLQDVNIGWLEKYRQFAPKRVMSGITITSRDEDNKIIQKGTYGNLDAVVQDARTSLLDPWFVEDPDLVVVTGRSLLNSREFPLVNSMSSTNPNTEAMAAQLLISRKLIGGLPTYVAPFVPEGAMLITSFSNLSIYWQLGKHRRLIREEPEYNRISTYESSNDAYVIEDYGYGCLIDGITWAGEDASA